MALFGSNLKQAILGHEAALAAIGFDFNAHAANPDKLGEALSAFVTGKVNEAKAAAGAELLKAAGLTAVDGKSAADVVKEALTGKDATITLYKSGLAAAGVKPTAAEGKELTADDIKTAVENRASQKGAQIAAAAGHDGALNVGASNDGAEPATAEEYVKAIDAETDNSKKWRLFEAYQKKFGLR